MTELKKLRMLSGTATYPVPRHGKDGWELRGRRADGSQFREWFRSETALREFDRKTYDVKQRVRRGLPDQQKPVTYRELVTIVLDQEKDGGSKWIREMLAYSLDEFGPVQVSRLRSHDIGRWINNLAGVRGEPLAGKTRQHVLGAMRHVLERGVAQAFLDTNPARATAVRAPNADETEVFPFESWAEVYAVAQQAGRYGPMIRLACATGLRPEEYLALTWADIDRAGRECHVRRTVVKGKVKEKGKTKNALRSVVLTDQAIAALDELPTPLRAEQLVFPAPQGGYVNLNNLRNRVWHRAVANAGLTARPLYQTRHTFATLALEATEGDLAWVSDQLGHEDIQVTRKHYARYLPPTHRRNLEKLNRAWGGDSSVSETCQEAEAQ